jgi:hypothetical protein
MALGVSALAVALIHSLYIEATMEARLEQELIDYP